MRSLMIMILVLVACVPARARTWTVEKDGTGDFTIIQDAIDASADGDTVRVGPGRYDTFRQYTSTIDGFTGMTIAWVNKGITLLGEGRDLSIIGPEQEVLEIDGLNPGCMYLDGGGPAVVRGFTFENARSYVAMRKSVLFEDNRIDGVGKDRSAGHDIVILNGTDTAIRNTELLGPGGILTANSGVGALLIENCSFVNENVPRSLARKAIASSAQALTVRGCTFEGEGVAVSNTFGGTALVEDSVMSVSIGGISVDIGSVVARNATIDVCEQNVAVAGPSASIELYECELRGGSIWTIGVAGNMLARDCTILNASEHTVFNPNLNPLTIDLRNNYWGTTDVEQVRAWISDAGNSVMFEPILLGPVSDDVQSISGLKSRYLHSN